MGNLLKELASIAPSDRVLLLPHCLRQTGNCRATYDSRGLLCAGCSPDCYVNILHNAALELGYRGVCVAPGGRLAVKFVREQQPKAVVAVACEKELQEGIQGVKALAGLEVTPLIIVIPLLKDGCVDTAVDVKEALSIIRTGSIMVGAGKRTGEESIE